MNQNNVAKEAVKLGAVEVALTNLEERINSLEEVCQHLARKIQPVLREIDVKPEPATPTQTTLVPLANRLNANVDRISELQDFLTTTIDLIEL